MVSKDYYFQMYFADLPFWRFIGKVDKEKHDQSDYKYLLFKHIHFDIFCNDARIIEINVQIKPHLFVDIINDKEVVLLLCFNI